MTESLLRIAYFAIGIYTFASAILTHMILSRHGEKSPEELFSLGTIWVSFCAFVLIITWATKTASTNPGRTLAESFLRVAFLTMGLFFFTCAFASTLAFAKAGASTTEWFGVGGLWIAFFSLVGIVTLASLSKAAPQRLAGHSIH